MWQLFWVRRYDRTYDLHAGLSLDPWQFTLLYHWNTEKCWYSENWQVWNHFIVIFLHIFTLFNLWRLQFISKQSELKEHETQMKTGKSLIGANIVVRQNSKNFSSVRYFNIEKYYERMVDCRCSELYQTPSALYLISAFLFTLSNRR